MKRLLVFIQFVFLWCTNSFALVPPLEREINLTLTNEPIKVALAKIQDQTGLIFSYQPAIVNGIGPVTLQLKHKTVREALALMLPKNIFYKSKNNYIILKEKPAEANPKKTEISGYVIDEKTEQKVANVTIYDKESLQSVTTDEYGYYSITVPVANDKITINKENYQDTTLFLSTIKDNKINNIRINPLSGLFGKKDSAFWKNKVKDIGLYSNRAFNKIKGFVNAINIKDTITRTYQVSLVPFVGTNRKLSGSVVNKLSLNILGGFSKGTKGFELGGIFNIDGENVKGAQFAGIFNIVGDSTRGTQIAGYFNINGDYMAGFQAAGLFNVNKVQRGVQVAGLMNINRESSLGASVAGLMNFGGTVRGAQVASIANINDTLNGVAVSGLFNSSKGGNNSAQVAGLFNKQKSGSTAFQLAGLFNRATYLKGVQIAPFNFADSAKGVPIGFLSFVKKGLHQLELSGDEFFGNLSFRTGVPSFYNTLSIGIKQGGSNSIWQFGYGVGTSLKLKNKFWADLSASMHHVSSGGFYFGTSELYRFYAGVEYKIGKKFSVAAGPTYNIYMSDALLPDYETTYKNIAPYYRSNTTNKYDFNFKSWYGGRVALRFL